MQNDLEKYARDLGSTHKLLASSTNTLNESILPMVADSYKNLTHQYKLLSKKVKTKTLTPAEKWFVENKSVVLETIIRTNKSLSKHLLSRLPTPKSNPNSIRMIEVLTSLVSISDYRLNYNRIVKYIESYQIEANLTLAELWSIPLVSNAILVNKLTSALGDEKVIKDIILGLRNLQKIDWATFVENVSVVDKILRRDPTGIYPLMDFRTRDSYRHVIEEVHFQTVFSQTDIACWVIKESELLNCHIGYFLFGAGRETMYREFRPKRKLAEKFQYFLHRRPIKIYLFLSWASLLTLFVFIQSLIKLPLWSIGLLTFPSFGFANILVHLIIVRLYPPSYLPKMDPFLAIDSNNRTIVLTPTLLTTNLSDIDNMLVNFEENYLANRDDNIFYGLALSWPETIKNGGKPDHTELNNLEYVKQGVNKLNIKYPSLDQRFHLFFRDRRWSIDEQSWVEWERKRGKVLDFVRLLRNPSDTSFIFNTGSPQFLSSIKYVIVIDNDVSLPRDSAKKLIATIIHPLNTPVVNIDTRMVVSGYGIIQPRISTQMLSTKKAVSDYIFQGDSGWDSYSNTVSNVYQDIFGESFFMGRGIFNVDIFDKILTGRFPENTLLSHDHIEGFYCRTGFASDITLYETYPSTYRAFYRRLHRWVRGDWQRIFWVFPWTGNEKGRIEKNPLSFFHRWKLIEDLAQNLIYPSTILILLQLFVISPGKYISGLVLFSAVFLVNPLLTLVESIPLHMDVWRDWKHHLLIFREIVKSVFLKSIFNLVFSFHQSLIIVHAICLAMIRIFITKRKRLEWTTFTQTNQDNIQYSYLESLYEFLPTLILLLIIFLFFVLIIPIDHILIPSMVFTLWFSMPILAIIINQPQSVVSLFSASESKYLRIIARKTWRYFDDLVNIKTNHLPPDHFQKTTFSPVSTRTSATNIGMYLLSVISSFDMGFITSLDLVDRFANIFNTLSKLDLLHGHFFNWYDISSLKTLPPSYISTVDSGNLACALLLSSKALSDLTASNRTNENIVRSLGDLLTIAIQESEPVLAGQLRNVQTKLKAMCPLDTIRDEISGIEVDADSELSYWLGKFKALLENSQKVVNQEKFIIQCQKLSALAESIAMNMDFSFLYDSKRNLFRIGYNFNSKAFDHGYYDLFASEARMASFFAIAKYDVPLKHWTVLAKPMTNYRTQTALLSWGGSIFEYLYPNLFFPNYPNSLLWESYHTVVAGHIDYGNKNRTPWGISESSYGLMNKDGHFRYKLHGVPNFAIKQYSYKDFVISPYAVFLAMEIFPRQSLDNIYRLTREGMSGTYGLYEAIDFTSYGSGPIPERVVKTYLCHHQGIILTAITNMLNHYSIRDRLARSTIIKSHLSLLQEAIPRDISISVNQSPPDIDISEEQTQIPDLSEKSQVGIVKRHETPQFNILTNDRYHVYFDDRGGGYSQYQNTQLTNWDRNSGFDSWGNFIYLRDQASQKLWSVTLAPTTELPSKYEVTFSQNYSKIVQLNSGIETQLEVVVPGDTDLEIRYLTIANKSAEKRLLELTNYTEIVLDEPASRKMHPIFSKMRIKSEYLSDSKILLFQRLSQPSVQVPMFASKIISTKVLSKIKYDTDRLKILGRLNQEIFPNEVTSTTGFTLDPAICWNTSFTLQPNASHTYCFLYSASFNRETLINNLARYSSLNKIKELIEYTKNNSVKYSFETINQRLLQQSLTCLIYGHGTVNGKYTFKTNLSVKRPQLAVDWGLPTMTILIRANTTSVFLRQSLNLIYYISNLGFKFNIVMVIRETDNYYQTSYNTILEHLNRQETFASNSNLISPNVLILRVEHFSSQEVKFLAATSSIVLDSKNGTVGAQINVEFNKI